MMTPAICLGTFIDYGAVSSSPGIKRVRLKKEYSKNRKQPRRVQQSAELRDQSLSS